MMKNIIYASILLMATIGYSQDRVSAKSNTPIDAVVVKRQTVVASAGQNRAAEINDVVLVKQSAPVESKIVNYIGTPRITYIEPITAIKRENP
jgi:hypothetical protein